MYALASSGLSHKRISAHHIHYFYSNSYLPITSQSLCSRSVNFLEVVDGTSGNKLTGFWGLLFKVVILSPPPAWPLIFWILGFCVLLCCDDAFPFEVEVGALLLSEDTSDGPPPEPELLVVEEELVLVAEGNMFDSQLFALITPPSPVPSDFWFYICRATEWLSKLSI